MIRRISPHTSNVLDLTRAIAAGLVVLFHATIYALGGIAPPGLGGTLAYSLTDCGTQAVFWFFVISGYLVGGSVLADLQRRFSFRAYLINRAVRLYIVLLPALALCYALDSIRIAEVGLNAHAGFETADSLSLSTLVGNLLFLQTILTPTYGSNYVLWSLACEFWYYLLFPLLLAPFMLEKRIVTRVLLFALGALLLVWLAHQNRSLAWLFVIWCIGAGVRVCPFVLIRSEILAWLIAAAAMLIFPFLHPVAGPLATLAVAISFACALNASHGKVYDWKYARIVQAFAAFSYSLYLVHLPIQHYLLTVPRGEPDPFLSLPPYSAWTAAIIGGLVVACYVSAYIFSLLTERHTQRLRDALAGLIKPKRQDRQAAFHLEKKT
jgi:peptidoglycan/LPS O-acetylase OafA/YrhL